MDIGGGCSAAAARFLDVFSEKNDATTIQNNLAAINAACR